VSTSTEHGHDRHSGDVLQALRGTGQTHDEAVAGVRALLLRAARFEVARRRTGLPDLRADELDDIALTATADALAELLRHLGDFGADRRLSTWVSKFALHETAIAVRRVQLDPGGWRQRSSRPG
jgi:RNA polymerase sigma-70 factor, ECF subfamily